MSARSKNGTRPVTLREVAERAGVSISTASRALNSTRRVTPTIIKRVQLAAKTLGYQPNEAARNLRLSRTMAIGTAYISFTSPIYLDILEGISSVCQERGYTVISTTARGDPELYRTLVRRHFERRVDALIIVLPPDLGDVLRPFEDADIPVLALFSRGSGSDHVPLLQVDEDAAIREAVERLRRLGHRRVLYVATPQGARSARAAALRREEARGAIALSVAAVPYDAPSSVVREVLEQSGVPREVTALFADLSQLAPVAGALAEAGLSVPHDVSVVAFSEAHWVGALGLPWSTIRIDLLRVGQATAQLILDWLDGTAPPDVTTAAVAEWVERASVGPARQTRP